MKYKSETEMKMRKATVDFCEKLGHPVHKLKMQGGRVGLETLDPKKLS